MVRAADMLNVVGVGDVISFVSSGSSFGLQTNRGLIMPQTNNDN